MDNAPSGAERRVHPRLDVKLQVRSRLLTPSELPQLAQGLGMAEPPIPQLHLVKTGSRVSQLASVNLSAGGLSAEGDLEMEGGQAFSKGTDLVVEFDLPDGGGPVRAVAQVMWMRPSPEGKPQAGLMFLLIAESSLARIQDFVKKSLS